MSIGKRGNDITRLSVLLQNYDISINQYRKTTDICVPRNYYDKVVDSPWMGEKYEKIKNTRQRENTKWICIHGNVTLFWILFMFPLTRP